MVWTEKVHTFLFCPETGLEIMVVKCGKIAALCAKGGKNKTKIKIQKTKAHAKNAAGQVRYEL